MKAAIKRWRDTSPAMEPVCRVLRATGLLPEPVWRHLAFQGIADFTVAGRRVRMRHFGVEVENSLFWAGYGNDWEATTLLVWERLAAVSAVTFDVGANSGLFALAAAAANPAGKVHAFEPMPTIAARLSENVALNAWPIEVHAAAVSDRGGTAQIKAVMADHQYSASFEHMEWMDHAEAALVDVPLVRLADVIAASGDVPQLLKLDVERHEPQALSGLWEAFPEAMPLPAMVIEILDDEVAEAVRAQIEPRGYRGLVIREGRGLAAEPLRAVPGTMNWLLVPPAATGFAADLIAAGGCTHAALKAGRPG